MPRTTRGCRVDFDENFSSDLLVKRCAGNVIDFHNYVMSLQSRLRGRILKSDEEKSSLLKLVE